MKHTLRDDKNTPVPPRPLRERGLGGEGFLRLPISPERHLQMMECARDFRKIPTPSEAILWQALRNRQVAGYKFRRQQPIGAFVVDFFCAEHNLIVEVDGAIHATQIERDQERQHLLECCGYQFLRFTATQVEQNLKTVTTTIESTLLLSPSPLEGEGLGVRGKAQLEGEGRIHHA
ncbi:MAG: endonuclease domain-containing protein [Thiothrix sp.]|uniref:endonuclease domain-containing protein n=1 Tax=Thiothrix sp. TaxID=1032 RepID=UPI00260A7BBF|nr:endonuclease domain-containing protein [Thiothrix sp.]MDD5391861.1 endonuclease domain-containing protein [Thiothrix sp.]